MGLQGWWKCPQCSQGYTEWDEITKIAPDSYLCAACVVGKRLKLEDMPYWEELKDCLDSIENWPRMLT